MEQAECSISGLMSADHDRLDSLLSAVGTAVTLEEKRARWFEFDAGLREHIRWEDEILFPIFEEKTGMRGEGPTAVMRVEHEEIGGLLKRIGDSLDEGGPTAQLSELRSRLGTHNVKEEMVLYPWIDREMSPAETVEALRQIGHR